MNPSEKALNIKRAIQAIGVSESVALRYAAFADGIPYGDLLTEGAAKNQQEWTRKMTQLEANDKKGDGAN